MPRRLDLSRPAPRRRPLPDEVTDEQWWADAEERYEEYWREFAGSPESFSTGAHWFYLSGEFGAAALMYQKAIDLLHTLYCCNDVFLTHEPAGLRQPSPVDLPIIDGYRRSLGAGLSMHPGAPVGRSLTEVVHRLTDIFFTCRRAGILPGPYGNALIELEPTARRCGIFIDKTSFAEPRATVINNRGIMASGNSIVSGNALASGEGAYAAVTGTSSASTEQITAMLRQFMDEISRSGHADKTELAATAEETCQELARPTPRRTRLQILGSGLAAAVRGTGSLAALAIQIEQAIHGL